jgi:hypothetical protein
MGVDDEKKGTSMARNSSMMGDSNKVKFKHSFQIWTQVDGYNSGRAYYLKASNAEECAEVMSKLKELARTARKLKDAKTRFQESQERIRVVYHSTIIQSIVATMIVAVLLPPSTAPTWGPLRAIPRSKEIRACRPRSYEFALLLRLHVTGP